MNAEIICVGTELVLGDILNTNAYYLSNQLALKGINVFYQISVGDNVNRLTDTFLTSYKRSDLIILTGGLGPTADDITMKTVAKALDIEMVKNEEAYARIVEYFKKIGRVLTKNNDKQAYLPKGSIVFQNEVGTAPGCVIEKDGKSVVFLPGPPSELKEMYKNSLDKYLDKFSDSIIKSKFVHIYGVGEAGIDDKAADLISGTDTTVAPYAKEDEAELRVTAKGKTASEAEEKIDKTVEKIKELFGDAIYGYDDDDLQTVVVRLLKEKHLTVATAESCTAGYISKRITDISGASEIFNMGITTYSNECKNKELHVPNDLIKTYGAVSEQVAACMAKGVRLKSGADIGLSITGIAGPNSDGTDKPIGLAYIGLSDKHREYVFKSQKSPIKGREYVRFASSSQALNLLRLYLLNGGDNLKNVKTVNATLEE